MWFNADRRLATSVFILSALACSASATAQSPSPTAERATPAKNVQPEADRVLPVQIDILDVNIRQLQLVSVDITRATIQVTMKVTNNSADSINLDGAQFSLSADKLKAQFLTVGAGKLLSGRQTTLKAGMDISGTLIYDARYSTDKEPSLIFTWQSGTNSTDFDLNKVIRRRSAIETKLIGPENCLAVVEIDRPVDHVAIWLLTDEFQSLKDRGFERVILEVLHPEKQSSSYSLRSTIGAWLASLRSGQSLQRFAFGNQIQSPVQFDTFFVVGVPSGTVRSTSSNGAENTQQADREHAVAKALEPVYSSLPLDVAMAGLGDKEAGIRRVSLEANIDRLSESQLRQLVKGTEGRSVAYRTLIAENLCRVPYAWVTTTLAELSLYEEPQISQAAISALVRSVSADAFVRVSEVWQKCDEDSERKVAIVEAILAADDHRYTALMTSHASQLLDAVTLKTSAERVTVTEEDADRSTDDESVVSATLTDRKYLGRVLDFLHRHGGEEIGQMTRECVLQIVDPSVQDIVMQHILKSSEQSDAALAEAYIEQRLPDLTAPSGISDEKFQELKERLGPRGAASQSRINMELLRTIKKFPDSSYTDRLLEISNSTSVSGSVKPEAFQVAVGCANHEQLQNLIRDFDELDKGQRTHLMRHLSAQNHPGWLGLADKCLNGAADPPEETDPNAIDSAVRERLLRNGTDDVTQNLAMSIMIQSGSAEAIQLIVDKLNSIREKAEDADTLEAADFRLSKRILATLPPVTYPEARRAINRCVRSPIQSLSDEASQSISLAYQNFFRYTPYQEEIRTVFELRKAKDYEGAILGFTSILKKEPFYYSAFISRGSLLMRVGSHELAMADLQRALELNPEDPTIESIIAIGLVRLGKVQEGITEAERIMNLIPDLDTMVRRDAIYNAACVYGRAIEVTADEKTKDGYMTRGMELLKDSIYRNGGFDDEEHFLDDTDLNAFHDQPTWNELVATVRTNEQKKEK